MYPGFIDKKLMCNISMLQTPCNEKQHGNLTSLTAYIVLCESIVSFVKNISFSLYFQWFPFEFFISSEKAYWFWVR